ncbi:MAG: SipW-dependent-type signal peptide-containing protein [Halobacteriota archaeon]
MTENEDTNTFEISRRKTLAALGTIGAASAGAGLGTSAWFSDTESFEGNTLTAGTLDLKVDWEEHYYDGSAGQDLVTWIGAAEPVPDGSQAFPMTATGDIRRVTVPDGDVSAFMQETAVEAKPDEDGDNLVDGGPYDKVNDKTGDSWDVIACEDYPDPDALERPMIEIEDLKPGDFGEVTFSLHLCDNPGYVWMTGELLEADENGVTEPEGADPAEIDDLVELLDVVQTSLWYDEDCDNQADGGETFIFENLSLRSALDLLSGSDPGLPLKPQFVDSEPNGEVDNPLVGPGTCSTRSTYDTVHTTGDVVTVDEEDVEISGNPKCGEFGLEETIKVESEDLPGDGNTDVYTTTYGDIEITQDGQTIQWRTDSSPDGEFNEDEDGFCMSKVAVKGGQAGGNVYSYDNDNGNDNFDDDADAELSSGETDEWLETPTGQDISHISFCIDPEYTGSNGNGDNGEEENGECFENSTTQCIGFEWWVPADTGNEIQSDRAVFDLGFYTEQCRHNDGSGTPVPEDNSS